MGAASTSTWALPRATVPVEESSELSVPAVADVPEVGPATSRLRLLPELKLAEAVDRTPGAELPGAEGGNTSIDESVAVRLPIPVALLLVPDPSRPTLFKVTDPDVSSWVPGDSTTDPLSEGNWPGLRFGPDVVNELVATVPDRPRVAGEWPFGVKSAVRVDADPVIPPVASRPAPVTDQVWLAPRTSGRLSVSKVENVADEGEDSVRPVPPTVRLSVPEIV